MRPLGFGQSNNNNSNSSSNIQTNNINNGGPSQPASGGPTHAAAARSRQLFSHFTGVSNRMNSHHQTTASATASLTSTTSPSNIVPVSGSNNVNLTNYYNNNGNTMHHNDDDVAMDDLMSDDDSDIDMNNENGMDENRSISHSSANGMTQHQAASSASIADVLSSSNATINRTLASLGGAETTAVSTEVEATSSLTRVDSGNNNSNMDTTSSNIGIASRSTEDPEYEKRKKIQMILRDKSLTNVEKNIRIQQLMDGRKKKDLGSVTGNEICISRLGKPTAARTSFSSAAMGSSSTGITSEDITENVHTINCVHYDRKCCIISPCCGKVFGCRVCHDEAVPPPCPRPLDRFKIKEIICKECRTLQPVSNKCNSCGIVFAEYHCGKCNIWMSNAKRPFHCDQCGFCRVGGRETFRHCNTCCMCISVTVYDTHNCMRDKYKNNCPVCTEDMFSSRQSPQDLPCGHAIHAHCFRKLAGFDYRCPVCKKTVVSRASMAAAWNARSRDIAMQPMPPDLARTVNITCNDCERKSDNCNFHFLGVQCPHCDSFNTQQLSTGDQGTAEGGASRDASTSTDAAPAS